MKHLIATTDGAFAIEGAIIISLALFLVSGLNSLMYQSSIVEQLIRAARFGGRSVAMQSDPITPCPSVTEATLKCNGIYDASKEIAKEALESTCSYLNVLTKSPRLWATSYSVEDATTVQNGEVLETHFMTISIQPQDKTHPSCPFCFMDIFMNKNITVSSTFLIKCTRNS
ncbi:MAG: hypothetical protein D6808_05710 [Candidatus Dadabacteria bacterium]|nr:MAG: hypothetical protein D6808_05710 [Candidatus Dadabacteria bacterium]